MFLSDIHIKNNIISDIEKYAAFLANENKKIKNSSINADIFKYNIKIYKKIINHLKFLLMKY